MNTNIIIVLSTALWLATTAHVSARTWTDAATNRSLEGEFVKVEGANAVIRFAGGRTVNIAINRLVEADQAFIKEQARKTSGEADAPPEEDQAKRSAGLAKYSPLTKEQKSRRDASGGNWTVSFEEEQYLGFVVTQRAKTGGMTQKFYWGESPSRDHRYFIQHVRKGRGNELTISPAREKGDEAPESADSSITFEFGDSEVTRSQRMVADDWPIKPGGPLVGRMMTLYKLENDSKLEFMLWVVFAEDTAPAEAELKKQFERYWSKQ